MGKKNKKLKKKKSIIATSYTPLAAATHGNIAEDSGAVSDVAPAITVKSSPSPATVQDTAEFQYVRKDVKKILLLLLAIVLLLIIIYFVDSKTHYLATTGNWFYKILNIQAQ